MMFSLLAVGRNPLLLHITSFQEPLALVEVLAVPVSLALSHSSPAAVPES
jgi:hypothetical protein